jgi:uncharacterized membrane protein HdeD (DUF308 family)
MKMPFTVEQFLQVFENYNHSLFPVQLIILLFAVLCLFFVHAQKKNTAKFVGAFLGLLWIWAGLVYHILFFSSINPAAYIFGGLFILEGILILMQAFRHETFNFQLSQNWRSYIGYFFILFGIIIYPLIGYFIQGLPDRIISLGLPCPSTILTFGFFMLASERLPKYLLIIPTIWALIGLSTAMNFGIYQDLMLLISALTANIFLLRKIR